MHYDEAPPLRPADPPSRTAQASPRPSQCGGPSHIQLPGSVIVTSWLARQPHWQCQPWPSVEPCCQWHRDWVAVLSDWLACSAGYTVACASDPIAADAPLPGCHAGSASHGQSLRLTPSQCPGPWPGAAATVSRLHRACLRVSLTGSDRGLPGAEPRWVQGWLTRRPLVRVGPGSLLTG